MKNLFVRVLERFTERLFACQREMYARTDTSGVAKWKTAMATSSPTWRPATRRSGSSSGAGWNRTDIAERVAQFNGQWRDVLTAALDRMMGEYGLDR